MVPIPAAGDASFPPLTFKARVRDPRNRLKGTVPARLTPAGLELGKGASKVELPVGTSAKYRGGNQLTVAQEGEQLELSVFKLFHYQNRLARDVAEFLNGERASLRAKDYALAWYLLLPAILPLGIPILTLGGAIPAAVGFGLAAAACAVAGRETWPAGLRVAVSLLLGLVGYAGLLALVVLTGFVSLPWFGRIADSQWQEFTPPDRRFHILLPGQPEAQSHNVPTPFGTSVLSLHAVQIRGNEYAVAYSDLPPALVRQTPVDVYLNGVRDGMIQTHQGKLTAERNVMLGPHAGRHFTFEMSKPKGKGAARIFRIQNRLYELIVVGRWLNPESKDVQKFFDSFALVNGPQDQYPEIATLFQRRYWATRYRVGAILATTASEPRLSDAPALGALATLCMDENAVKVHAVKSLFRTHPRHREELLALLRHFLRESAEARLFGISALAALGPAARPAVPDLQYLTQPSWPPEVRKAAADALRKIQADPPAGAPTATKPSF
jgi:hypothetical protein